MTPPQQSTSITSNWCAAHKRSETRRLRRFITLGSFAALAAMAGPTFADVREELRWLGSGELFSSADEACYASRGVAIEARESPAGGPNYTNIRVETTNRSGDPSGSGSNNCTVFAQRFLWASVNGTPTLTGELTDEGQVSSGSITRSLIEVEHSHEPEPTQCDAGIRTTVNWDGTGAPADLFCLSGCEFDAYEPVTSVPSDNEGQDYYTAQVESNGNECTAGANVPNYQTDYGDNDDNTDNQTPDNGTDPDNPSNQPDPDPDPDPDTDTNTDGETTDDNSSDDSNDNDGDSDSGDSGPSSGDGTPSSGDTGTDTASDGDEDGPVDSITGGGSCDAPPTCSGDVLLCAINMQTWNARCDLQTLPSEDEILNETGLANIAGDDLNSDTIDLPSAFDDSGFLSSRQCPAPLTVQAMGNTITFSLQAVCNLAGIFSVFVVLGGTLHSTRILLGD